MNKETIAELLDEKHQTLSNWLNKQDAERWETGPEGKWTTGQHVIHLLQSMKPLNTALSLPKFILKFKFGTSNRAVRDFDTVKIGIYNVLKEAKGITFKGSQNMKVPSIKDKQYIINRLLVENKKLQYKTRKWSDKDLDTYILPHPLMGKMPVRELLMWTAYHIEHHTDTLKERY